MGKRILVLSGSPREGGNSDILCDEFIKGAKSASATNKIRKFRVADMDISPCRGCDACRNNGGKCVIGDDMDILIEEFIASDIIVLASPVYFYSVCAQLKTALDRVYAKFEQVKEKQFYFIATSGEDAKYAMDTTFECMRGFVDCCEGSYVEEEIAAHGLFEKGDVINTPYMTEAFEMGEGIF